MCNVEKKMFKATQQNEKMIEQGKNYVYEFGLMLNLNGVQ
jgi:hypothetical protein